MYTGNSPILGVGKSSAAQIDRFFEIRGRSYAGNDYRPAPAGLGQMIRDAARRWPQSVNHDLLAAQIVHEAAAWQSEYSRERNNPSGLGAVNHDPDQAIRFATPQDGIRATVAHLLTYVSGPGPWTEHDPRAEATPADWQGSVKLLRELEQKWAFTKWDVYNATPEDQRYGAKIAQIANLLLQVEVGDVPDDLPMNQCIIKQGRGNRPGLRLDPSYVTVHETANTNRGADAGAHCQYIRSDAAANRPASWHVTVDDDSAYQHLPFNEVAWHAGDGHDGKGNRRSLAIELCVNSDGDWEATKRNAARVVRGWMDTYAIPIERVVQHGHWSDTSCPLRMRQGDWPGFLDMLRGETQQEPPPSVPTLPPTVPEPNRDSNPWNQQRWIPVPFMENIDEYDWAVTGWAVSEAFVEDGKLVQYFERARLELQPDGTVTRGLTGYEVMVAKHPERAA